ncbi:MAG: radical SAM family heme chaperone HemW [Gammaproteobacteria bacterium]|nr:MAG: radical SAM family heme chaperone HemW [Gammaproteobacteria bacterium]
MLPPLALYIHFPWCIRKCPYCDFNSHGVGHAGFDEAGYLAALASDLEMSLPAIESREVRSVFIGGGTPSLLSGAGAGHMLQLIESKVALAPDCEITLEANPGAADLRRFAEYRAAGVNRLSIGIQSFNDTALRALGRVHDSSEARAAIVHARHAGFTNLNLDIIHTLPGQTVPDAVADLQTAIEFRPEHLSWYQLTIEPGTVFSRNPPILPDEDTGWEIQEAGRELLAAAGYENYEISAWAKAEDTHCVHNLNYWRFGDYLGIGAGAHSKLSNPLNGGIRREVRQASPAEYMRYSGTTAMLSSNYLVEGCAIDLEFMLNALRLREGFSSALFEERTGHALATIRDRIEQGQDLGLIEIQQECIRPTVKGQRYLNDLLQLFV